MEKTKSREVIYTKLQTVQIILLSQELWSSVLLGLKRYAVLSLAQKTHTVDVAYTEISPIIREGTRCKLETMCGVLDISVRLIQGSMFGMWDTCHGMCTAGVFTCT